MLLGFVLYALAYSKAIVDSTGAPAFGRQSAELPLADADVVLAVLLVPGTKASWRLGVARRAGAGGGCCW